MSILNTLNPKYKRKPCKSTNLAQLQKALGLIEELCLEHDDMCDEDKQGGVVSQIYTLAHALNGCGSGKYPCPIVKKGIEILENTNAN